LRLGIWGAAIPVALTLTGFCATSAAAAPAAPVETQPPNAADAEASFNEARKAAAAGDVVGAIVALERVLQSNPDLANVKLELGLLYLRAGNLDLAKSYLQAAVDAPGAPPGARARARQALADAQGGLRQWTVSGGASLGLQYQSNPNGSPTTVSVVGPGGTPVLVSGDDLSIPRGQDGAVTAAGSLEVRYHLPTQRNADLLLDLNAARTQFDQTTDLNSTYLGARAGPRIGWGVGGFIQPFVSATQLDLGGKTYFDAEGAGVAATMLPSVGVALSGRLAWENRDFKASAKRLSAPEQSGGYWSGGVDLTWTVTPRLQTTVGVLGESVNADRDYWSRDTWGLQGGVNYAWQPPFGHQSWIGHFGASYQHSGYSGPDPLIDPTRTRAEDRTELDLGLTIPLNKAASFDLGASQIRNDANIPNFKYDNTIASLGVSIRF
jgi:hypothetical protein